MRESASRIVFAPAFEYAIIGIIIANGVLLGLETFPSIHDRYWEWMQWGHRVTLGIFIVEALLKMYAVSPRVDRYFRDPWNVFDFSIIVFSLIPATGSFAVIARLARLLRLLRLVSTVKELRLIVATLVRSIPSMMHILILMGLIVYIYAIIGYQLFHEHDAQNWGGLGASLLTLFNILTLEGWTDVLVTAMNVHPLAWIYFVSFIVIGTFVVVNLFIAVVINNLDEAKQEKLRSLEQPESLESILRELRTTQRTLQQLEERLEQAADETRPPAQS